MTYTHALHYTAIHNKIIRHLMLKADSVEKMLLTGANGFISHKLSKKLLESKEVKIHKVHAIGRYATGKRVLPTQEVSAGKQLQNTLNLCMYNCAK